MARPGEDTSTVPFLLRPYNPLPIIFTGVLDSAGHKQLEARLLSPSETAAISSEVETLSRQSRSQ
jgi:hypothetical protein